MIFKRTFEAKKYPKGSKEREKLNESVQTSEYMTSHKYCIIEENFSSSFRTKHDAERWLIWRDNADPNKF